MPKNVHRLSLLTEIRSIYKIKAVVKKEKEKKKKKSSVLGMLQTTSIFLNISGIFFMWLQFDPFYHLIAPIFLAYNESTCTSWLLFCNP